MTNLDIAFTFCLVVLVAMLVYLVCVIIKAFKFEKVLKKFRSSLKPGDAVSIYGQGISQNAKVVSINVDGTVNISIKNISKNRLSIPNE